MRGSVGLAAVGEIEEWRTARRLGLWLSWGRAITGEPRADEGTDG